MENARDINRPHVYIDNGSNSVTLLLHGTGADEHDLLNLGKMITPESNFLSPRGMLNESGMNRFFERTPAGEFVQSSVLEAAEDLVSFIDSAALKYGFEPKGLTAIGFSNGGNMALALLVLRPQLLDVVVAMGATKPLAEIAEKPDLSGKKVWIANGDQDGYAPNHITKAWVSELTEYGSEVTWLRHPGGHQVSPEHIQQINRELA